MTPLERMAAAIDEQITGIYGSPPDRGEGAKIARTALLALAEADLQPSHAVITGPTGMWTNSLERVEIFRAMCRAIAEDRG